MLWRDDTSRKKTASEVRGLVTFTQAKSVFSISLRQMKIEVYRMMNSLN